MLHKCPDSAVIRPKKAGYRSRLSLLQAAGQCKYRVFISPRQLPRTPVLLPWVAQPAVGLHTCKLLLPVSFICASPNLTNSPHWNHQQQLFQHLQFYFSHDFSPFSPPHRAKHQLPSSFFSPSVYSTAQAGEGDKHLSPGQSSSLASAALLIASHLQEERKEGENWCPCSAAEVQLVSLFTC